MARPIAIGVCVLSTPALLVVVVWPVAGLAAAMLLAIVAVWKIASQPPERRGPWVAILVGVGVLFVLYVVLLVVALSAFPDNFDEF